MTLSSMIFIRHAKPSYLPLADQDLPLAEEGQKTAHLLQQTVGNQADLLISSIALRAKQTAEIINAKKKATLILEKDLYIPFFRKANKILLKKNLLEICLKHGAKSPCFVSHNGVMNQLAMLFFPHLVELQSLEFSFASGFIVDVSSEKLSLL